MSDFNDEVNDRIREAASNSALKEAAQKFMYESTLPKYSYNFSWLGRPIIQYPQDMVAMQELIWKVKPDLIIEMGIAHGGSLIMSASLLAMLDLCESQLADGENVQVNLRRKVLGVDVDIRAHNRKAIESHPLAPRIDMIEASSIDPDTVAKVHKYAEGYSRIMVCLDSNHTHDHVFAELEAYASLTSIGSYCVVFDTVIEDLPKSMYPDRPWGPGNNPRTAVDKFLVDHREFEIDRSIENKLQITVAAGGYLQRVS